MDLIKLIFLKVFYITIINAGTPVLCHMEAPGQDNGLEGELSLKDYSSNNLSEPLKKTESTEPLNSGSVELTVGDETFDVTFPDGVHLSKEGGGVLEDSSVSAVLSVSPDLSKEVNDEDETEAYMKSESTDSPGTSDTSGTSESTTTSGTSESANTYDNLKLGDLLNGNVAENMSKQLFGEYSKEYVDDYNKSVNEGKDMDPNKEYSTKTMVPPNSLLVLGTPSGCSLMEFKDEDDDIKFAEFKFKVSQLEDCDELTKQVLGGIEYQLAKEISLGRSLGGTPETKMVEISIRDPMRNRQLNIQETTQVFTSNDRSRDNGNVNGSSSGSSGVGGSSGFTGSRTFGSTRDSRFSDSKKDNKEFEGYFDQGFDDLEFDEEVFKEAQDTMANNLDLQFLPTSSDSVIVMSFSLRTPTPEEQKRDQLMNDFFTLIESAAQKSGQYTTLSQSTPTNRSHNTNSESSNTLFFKNTTDANKSNNMGNMDDLENTVKEWFAKLQQLPTEMFEKFVAESKKLLETDEGKEFVEKLGEKIDKEFKERQELIKKEVSVGKKILDDLSKHGMDNVECSKLKKEECNNYSKCQIMNVEGNDMCFISPKTILWLMGTNCGLQSRTALMSIARDLKNVGYLSAEIVNNLGMSLDSQKICEVITQSYLSKLSTKEDQQPNKAFN